VLSDAQLEAVVHSFDVDGSGQVDTQEFSTLINHHIATSQGQHGAAGVGAARDSKGERGEGDAGALAGAEGGAGAGASDGSGDGNGVEDGSGSRRGVIGAGTHKVALRKGPRDGRAVIGLQWDTSPREAAMSAAPGEHFDAEVAAAAAAQLAMERMLADAIAQLFYTHRRELFHIWNSHFDPDGTGSIGAEAGAQP